MKKLLVASTLVMPLVLVGCAGGGGGSSPVATVATPTPTSTPTPTPTPTPTVVNATGVMMAFKPTPSGFFDDPAVTSATLATANAATNQYQLQIPGLGIDTQITVADSYPTVGGVKTTDVTLSNGTILRAESVASGTTLSYSRLGDWQLLDPKTRFPTELGLVVVGTPTPVASMPTTGTASYSSVGGGVVTGFVLLSNQPNAYAGTSYTILPMNGSAGLSVNFGAGTIDGRVSGMSYQFNGSFVSLNDVTFHAPISGSTFAGAVSVVAATVPAPGSTPQLKIGSTGTVAGSFYGPNAQELAGVFNTGDGGLSVRGGFATLRH